MKELNFSSESEEERIMFHGIFIKVCDFTFHIYRQIPTTHLLVVFLK